MFTGLIESVGRVGAITPTQQGVRWRVETALAPELAIGDSLATNGCCLTVVEKTATDVAMDISPETLRVTTLGDATVGSLLNLERPMRADARFGGHMVSGHIDATGVITAIQPEGEFFRILVGYPAELAPFLIYKGSIAVDGISLTVASLHDEDETFSVQIIPHTWTHTNLSAARPGTRVNLEVDLVGKYVVRAAELASRRVTA
jgi:riboflavin synthase